MDPPAVPDAPVRDTLPPRADIAVPLRGRGLRDRYVLRLIAVERAVHVVVLSGLAVAVFLFIGHRATLRHDYVAIINGLFGSSGGPDARKGLLGDFRHLFIITPSHLYDIGFLLVAYATLEAVEMVGLWFTKRWAEYLTFVATTLFVPLEVYELLSSVRLAEAGHPRHQPGRGPLPASRQAPLRAPRWTRRRSGAATGRRWMGGDRTPASRRTGWCARDGL